VRLETTGRIRILDFDCECRPIAWYGGDWVTKQPTAIAWKFIGERGRVYVAVIGESYDPRNVLDEEAAMLERFRAAYDAADIVTGHFIRGFDLPLLNGALMRLGLPLLGAKDTQDTKLDLVKGQGISKSQENLGAMYELRHPKVGMNTGLWMKGNLLLPDGIEATKKRVVGDVRQHIELRQAMLDRGHLMAAAPWSSGGGTTEQYRP
jgi:DNA polymerase elongation subunit (family B)